MSDPFKTEETREEGYLNVRDPERLIAALEKVYPGIVESAKYALSSSRRAEAEDATSGGQDGNILLIIEEFEEEAAYQKAAYGDLPCALYQFSDGYNRFDVGLDGVVTVHRLFAMGNLKQLKLAEEEGFRIIGSTFADIMDSWRDEGVL